MIANPDEIEVNFSELLWVCQELEDLMHITCEICGGWGHSWKYCAYKERMW